MKCYCHDITRYERAFPLFMFFFLLGPRSRHTLDGAIVLIVSHVSIEAILKGLYRVLIILLRLEYAILS